MFDNIIITSGQTFEIMINKTQINCNCSIADVSGEYGNSCNLDYRNGQEICNTFIDDNGEPFIASNFKIC